MLVRTSLVGVLVCSALSVGLPVAPVVGPGVGAAAPVALTAATSDLGATVLTLEGGLIGIQHTFYFTPRQLGGRLCAAPNTCDPVDYDAWPLGERFNERGADRVIAAVDALPSGTPTVLFGHSQGGQVIYSALRRWAANPAAAPDPARLSWVSIGNPENAVGGRAARPLPADSPYPGTEVIKQYDGWADWPTDTSNLLAVANALVGMSSTHMFGYFGVDINDPDNIRYTPERPDGTPGTITYVFVPTPVLPLVAMTGLLAPVLNPLLDPILRPMVEAGYQRPFGAVGSSARSAAAQAPPPVSAPVSVDLVADPAPEVQVLNDGDTHQDREQDQRHDGRTPDRGRPERLSVNPVRHQVGATGRAAAGQRVNRVENLRGADDSGH